MPNYDEIIKQSQANVKSLSEKLNDLDKLYLEIKALKESAEGIPAVFNNKFQEVVKLSESYTNTLGVSTKTYLDGNNTIFTTKLNELSTKIKEFDTEVKRLLNTDFTKLFKDLQKIFIDQTRDDLAKELKRFEEKAINLQTKIDDLKTQTERLEKVDLDKHFDKLQKTLSEIFGAVNAINSTLTNFIQTLTGIVQTLGTIQTSLDTNHKETKQTLKNLGEVSEKHLAEQDKQVSKNFELLEGKLKSVSEQNELLKKEVKTNRIIQIVGLTITLIVLIYLAVK